MATQKMMLIMMKKLLKGKSNILASLFMMIPIRNSRHNNINVMQQKDQLTLHPRSLWNNAKGLLKNLRN